MEKKARRDAQRASIVAQTANIMGVSARYVNMVIRGDRENERVMLAYMELLEGNNKLLAAVRELVPFDPPRNVELRMGYVNCD